MRVITLPFFLVVIPLLLGFPWVKKLAGSNIRGFFLCVPLGYFLQAAVFQFLEMPFAWLGFSFSSLCVVYIVVILLFSIVSVLKSRKYSFQSKVSLHASHWTIIFATIFFALLIYQLYNALTMDRTYMSYDDAYYVAVANDTIKHDSLFVIDAYSGLRSTLDFRRTIQSSLVFPAFLSYTSGIPVVIIEHTVLDLYYLLLAYFTYAYIGILVFKQPSECLLFLIILSIVFIFGNYSIYSLSMRLLGLNYVGKAIIAFLFFPLLLGLMIENLGKDYSRVFGFVLLFLSASASGLTLFGTVTMIIVVSVLVILSLFYHGRQIKKLLYITWGCVLPVVYLGLYFATRLLV